MRALLWLMGPWLLGLAGGDSETPGDMFPRTETVETRKGSLQGRTITLLGGEFKLEPVDVFLGIPYALPPVGPRRFSPTSAHPPWSGILQAISYGPACPQQFPSQLNNRTQPVSSLTSQYWNYLTRVRDTLTHQAEDCLYLNIFRPHQSSGVFRPEESAKDRPKLAVLVFIHGESWSWGSASLYDARVLAALGKVIVVTFNYRIGILGWLNTNPSPNTNGHVANYGLIDQMAALQWVVENIAQFGGDPSRITVMGQGGGAASVEYLVHSPMIRQSHFQRVILMSGSIFSGWARVDNPAETGVRVARSLGCPLPADLHTHHSNILDCLRGKSVEQLLAFEEDPLAFKVAWGPSYDGVTVKNNFVEIKGKRSFDARQYDALVGVTSSDWFHRLGSRAAREGLSVEERDRILRSFVLNNYDAHLQEIFLAVRNEYGDWDQPEPRPSVQAAQLVSALSDALYVAPALHSAGTFYRRRNNTFLYHFNHHTKAGMYAKVDSASSSYGQELDYVFGIPISPVWPHQGYHYTRAEAVLSALVITYWANFVKEGNPNHPVTVEELLNTDSQSSGNTDKRFKMVTWEHFGRDKSYLELDLKPRPKHNFRGHAASLWLSLVPKLESAGSYDSVVGHGMLWGKTQGKVRNITRLPGAQQISAEEASQPCKESGLASPAEGSHPGSRLIALGLLAGSSLFLVNSVIFACLCYRRTQHRPRWDRASGCTGGADSTECLNNSLPETPHRVPSFSTPGRTSTLRRAESSSLSRERALPLTSYPPHPGSKAGHECQPCSTVSKRRGQTSHSNSYVSIPPPDHPDLAGLPLVADIPAPGGFGSKAATRHEDSITC